MIIGGFQKCSLIDYPEKIAAIIFTQGCNFKCAYCHNPELLKQCQTKYSFDEILSFLKKRVGKLDGVVITGGEPSLQKDLVDCITKIKNCGFSVKLDSNGTNPKIIEEVINLGLVDYIAMDVKAPLHKYSMITGGDVDVFKIAESIDILKTSNVKYEFRTTVLKKFLSKEDFEQIAQLLNGADKYYIQKFVSTKVLDENLKCEVNYTDKEFEEILEIFKGKVKFVGLR